MKKAPIIGIPVSEPIFLHVHHTFYIFRKLPWEYEASTLKTVCGACHIKIHESEIIPVYIDNTFKELMPVTPCKRCKGTGFLNEYQHVQDGICFRCFGRKFEEFI